MIEKILAAFTKGLMKKIQERYDDQLLAIRADIEVIKSLLNPPAPPVEENPRPVNIHYGIVSNSVGAYPAGIYQDCRYNFDFEFVPREGATLKVLRHYNTFSMQLNFSNLEVTGEGALDVVLVQKMYDANGLDGDIPLFVNRKTYVTLNITRDVIEYGSGSLFVGLTADQMYQLMLSNRNTLDSQS